MRLALLAAIFMGTALGQVVITNSGSTNIAGMSVTLAAKGRSAMVESRGSQLKMNLPADLHTKLMQDLEAAGPLDQLRVRHCAKSVSFGTRTSITYKRVESPDLSCSGQTDPAVIALQKDMDEIMSQAHAKMPAHSRFR